jgi:hypothetical protein
MLMAVLAWRVALVAVAARQGGRRLRLECRADRTVGGDPPHAQFVGQDVLAAAGVLSPVRSAKFTLSRPTVITGVSPLNETAEATPLCGRPFASV